MLFKSSSTRTNTRLLWSEAPVNDVLLDVRDLRVEYLTDGGAARAVDGVSFSLKQGEVLGLAGESGCGKSTIAHALIRTLRPPALITGGQIIFQDRDVLDMPYQELEDFRWRSISLVFQSALNALNPVMTVGDQIIDAIQAHQPIELATAQERAAGLLTLVGIEQRHLKSYPHQLSGGMRQRAVIAIALALTPPLVILDEPTTALDVVVQKEIMQQIERLKQQLELSILFITHDLSLLVEFATRIAVMYAGEIVEMAPARELLMLPLQPYTQGLMNSFPSISGERKKLTGIPGAPPDLLNLPHGCRFHPRCPMAKPICSQTAPLLRLVGKEHQVACHLY